MYPLIAYLSCRWLFCPTRPYFETNRGITSVSFFPRESMKASQGYSYFACLGAITQRSTDIIRVSKKSPVRITSASHHSRSTGPLTKIKVASFASLNCQSSPLNL